MEILKKKRNQLKLGLAEVARRAELPKATLSDLEAGRYLPTEDVAAKLAEILQLPVLPNRSQLLTNCQMRALGPQIVLDLKSPCQRPWLILETRHPRRLQRSKVPPNLLAWMKMVLLSDSVTECITYCDVGGVGAREAFANPHRCGFLDLPCLDTEGRALGDRPLPALSWEVDGKPCLLWPQVSVMTALGPFRLDYLVLYQGQWLNVEVDGPSHSAEDDAYRQKAIGLTVARIDHRRVWDGGFVDFLRDELRKLAA